MDMEGIAGRRRRRGWVGVAGDGGAVGGRWVVGIGGRWLVGTRRERFGCGVLFFFTGLVRDKKVVRRGLVGIRR